MTTDVIGYLVWRRGMNGAPQAMKHLKEMRDGAMPETKKRFEEETIMLVPLDIIQWNTTLDALIRAYPAPKQSDQIDRTRE